MDPVIDKPCSARRLDGHDRLLNMLLEAIPRTEGFKELLRQRRIHWMVLLVFSVGPKWEEKAFEGIRRDFVQLRLLQQVVENALDFGEALPPRLFD